MSGDTPRRIGTNDELRDLHAAGIGYVYNHFYHALHKASCDHVERMTVGSAKTFYATLDEVHEHLGGEVNPCPDCLPLSAATSASRDASASGSAGPPAMQPPLHAPAARRAEFEGPGSIRGVYAWLDSRLPFDNLDQDQRRIRSELRSRLSRLVAREGEVLHASFAGPRHPGSDIENILLYNVDMDGGSFRSSARRGVRFEVAPAALRKPPSGAEFDCAYAYRFTSVDNGFAHWKIGRDFARFEGVMINAGNGSLLSRTWFALHRATVQVAGEPNEVSAPFAVRLSVRGLDASSPAVVKSLVDGVVAGLQVHGDESSLGEVSRRVGVSLGLEPQEIARLLTRRERAVLGVRGKLLWPWRDVVQWNPGDDLCLAGQLLSDEAATQPTVSGSVSEIKPR
jgi:hypothetical protein